MKVVDRDSVRIVKIDWKDQLILSQRWHIRHVTRVSSPGTNQISVRVWAFYCGLCVHALTLNLWHNNNNNIKPFHKKSVKI